MFDKYKQILEKIRIETSLVVRKIYVGETFVFPIHFTCKLIKTKYTMDPGIYFLMKTNK